MKARELEVVGRRGSGGDPGAVTLKIERIRARELSRQADRQQLLEISRQFGDGFKDIAITALSSPVISLVLANVLIEALQRVKISTGEYETLFGDPEGRGVHNYYRREIKEPLISQELGSTIETVINTGAVVSSIGIPVASIISGLRK